jgi:hypothetical protein
VPRTRTDGGERDRLVRLITDAAEQEPPELAKGMLMAADVVRDAEAPPPPKWRLLGWDTFEEEWYPLGREGAARPGNYLPAYPSREAAITDGERRLTELERTQARAGTLRDQVWLVSPVGEYERLYGTHERWRGYIWQRLAELEDGAGDFTGLHRPSPATIELARRSIPRLLGVSVAAPSVVPDEDGAVVLVWRRKGWDIEVTFMAGRAAQIWGRSRANGGEFSGPATEDVIAQQLVETLSLISRD